MHVCTLLIFIFDYNLFITYDTIYIYTYTYTLHTFNNISQIYFESEVLIVMLKKTRTRLVVTSWPRPVWTLAWVWPTMTPTRRQQLMLFLTRRIGKQHSTTMYNLKLTLARENTKNKIKHAQILGDRPPFKRSTQSQWASSTAACGARSSLHAAGLETCAPLMAITNMGNSHWNGNFDWENGAFKWFDPSEIGGSIFSDKTIQSEM